HAANRCPAYLSPQIYLGELISQVIKICACRWQRDIDHIASVGNRFERIADEVVVLWSSPVANPSRLLTKPDARPPGRHRNIDRELLTGQDLLVTEIVLARIQNDPWSEDPTDLRGLAFVQVRLFVAASAVGVEISHDD